MANSAQLNFDRQSNSSCTRLALDIGSHLKSEYLCILRQQVSFHACVKHILCALAKKASHDNMQLGRCSKVFLQVVQGH